MNSFADPQSPSDKTQSPLTTVSVNTPIDESEIQATTRSSEPPTIPEPAADVLQSLLPQSAGNSLSSLAFGDTGSDMLLDGLPFTDMLPELSDGTLALSSGMMMPNTSLDCFTSPFQTGLSFMSEQNSTVPSLTGHSESSSAWTPGGEFVDSYHLPVHELTLIKAMMRVADRLGCGEEIWSLETLSPFNTNTSTPTSQLPSNWQPTICQIEIPHHPIVDLLPWPQVRNKLLSILTLPDAARPPGTAGSMVFVNLAYDLEDNAEGVRIYNGDPYDPESWEVGQVLFERWWFLFDREIIERSNRWRASRGAPPLRLK